MEFLQPTTWTEALEMKAAHPEALPIAGGTDVMVEINFDRQRPAAVIDLTKVAELEEWETENGMLRVGAGVTYSRIIFSFMVAYTVMNGVSGPLIDRLGTRHGYAWTTAWW